MWYLIPWRVEIGYEALHHKIKCIGAHSPSFHDFPVFSTSVSSVSKLIDLPIQGVKLLRDKSWEGIGDATANQEGRFLFLEIDPTKVPEPEEDKGDSLFRMPRWYRQNVVGNVLIVRADGKDLLPKQLQVLSRFCQFSYWRKVESWSELADESHEEASQPVAQATTPAEFYHYFKEYKDSKSVEDPSNAREWNYSDNSGYVGSVVCLIQLHSGRF
jgi:hypothetical protein